MNTRENFRTMLAEKDALQKLLDFEYEYPEFGDCGHGIFATQERDENGKAVRGNSVSILFDANRYDSIDQVLELAKFYVKLRDGLNARGMYGCLPGHVNFKNPDDGNFTYSISVNSNGCSLSWRKRSWVRSNWETKYFTYFIDVNDILRKIDVVEGKPVKIYSDTKVNYSRNPSLKAVEAEIKHEQARLLETLTGVKPIEIPAKDQLFAIEDRFDDIKTIGLYLALNPEHKVSYMFAPIMRHELTYDYNKGYCLQSFLNGEAVTEPHHHKVMFDEFVSVIKWAKETEPSDEYKDTFETKWDEIKGVTEVNMNFNRDKKGRNYYD
jgi:hypothetical protein